ARRGIGRDLIAHLAALAATRGMAALTLTTFTDVPWNAPYYARIGFRVLAERELTEGLRAIRAEEAQHGLDRWPRVCMRRELAPAVRPSGATGAVRIPRMPDPSGAPDTSEAVAVSGGT
ncbi:GNAT family N-acetyltransferase, partial [Streptomyces sp. SID7499]|nr:GNAT family N-acetyltransferase [Streptomyces sp. SID7499]